jgi:hypothetical protein
MPNPEQAHVTQLRRIEDKTGRDLTTLRAEISAPSNAKHGDTPRG